MTIFDDFSRLDKNNLPAVTILFGENEDLVQEFKQRIFQLVNYDTEDISQSYFDLAESESQFALEELESLPFFSDEHLVIFENLWNLSPAKKTVFDEKNLKRFENYLEQPNETTKLIIILHGKLDSRLKLSKKIKKIAFLLEATNLKAFEIKKILQKEIKLAPVILERILAKSNDVYSVSKQNIELVRTYAAGREITIEDVEKVVPKSLQDKIFDLTDFIFQKKVNEARSLAKDLLLQGEDEIKLTSILTDAIRINFQVKLMQEKNYSEQQMQSILKIHPFRLQNANKIARRQGLNYLAEALRTMINLDYQIKTSQADKNFLFDLALIKLTDKT